MRRINAAVLGAAVALALLAGGTATYAAEAEEPEHREWAFYGIFGTFDRAALQRGYRVYRDVCAACHGMKYLSFRNLAEIGFTEGEAEAIAAEFIVEDGPDAEGEFFERAARLSDTFPNPYENENQARAFNAGALPPDLTLITRNREYGPDYLVSLLTGYEEAPPDDLELGVGMSYNPFFTGFQIAMPQPLFGDDVEYVDGTEASIEQMSLDVTEFLTWASDPSLERRHRMGIQVMVFLVLLTIMFVFVKRKVWRDVH